MANRFHNTQTTNERTAKESKSFDQKRGTGPKNDSLTFKTAHKPPNSDLLGIPKNLGGSFKEKHKALDVV